MSGQLRLRASLHDRRRLLRSSGRRGSSTIARKISVTMASTTRTAHPREHRIIFKNIDRPDWTNDIDCYLQDGGYEDLKKAIGMNPQEIVNEVKVSGLRG